VTVVLLTCPDIPGSRVINLAVKPTRVFLARTFTSRYRGRALDDRIAWAAPLKALDKNMSDTEVAACLRLGDRARARAAR